MNGWPDPDDPCPYCLDPDCPDAATCGGELDSPEEETP